MKVVVVCEEKKRNIERLKEGRRRIGEIERLSHLHNRLKKRLKDSEISREEFEVEKERQKEQEEKTLKCWNCDGEFSPNHQCYL